MWAQLQYNGGGRDAPRVEHLVRVFNWLILCSLPLVPAFGRLLDRCGVAAGFSVVNTLGIGSFLGIALCSVSPQITDDLILGLSFVAYGLFRAFNYSTLTAFVQGVFGHETFGTLYGIGVGVVAVSAAAVQSPVTSWAVTSVESGAWDSFAPLDVGIVLVSVALFGFPAWIVWVSRAGSGKASRAAARAKRSGENDGEVAAA